MRVKLTFVIFFTAIASMACGSLSVKDNQTFEVAKEKGVSGEKEGWQAIEEALKTPPPHENPDLHKQILTDLAETDHPEARRILWLYAGDRIPAKRGTAVFSLYQQSDFVSREKHEERLVRQIRANGRKYNGLLPEEISTLGALKNPDSLDVLAEYLGRNSNDDPVIIQALGRKLEMRDVSVDRPVETETVNTDETGDEAQPETTSEEATPDDSAGTTGSDEFDELLPDLKGGENETSVREKAAGILTDYLLSDASDDLKVLAMNTLYSKYGPDETREKLVELALQGETSQNDRKLMLVFLAEMAVLEDDETLYPLYAANLKKHGSDETYAEPLKAGIEILKQIQPQEKIEEKVEPVKKKKPVRPKIRWSYVKKLRSMNRLEALAHIARKYGISRSTINRMHNRPKSIAARGRLDKGPESGIYYASLRRIYPDYNFFKLREKLQQSLYNPRFFSTTMRIIVYSKRSRGWQINAIRQVWGVSTDEAGKIRRMYRHNRHLLRKARL